MKRIYFALVFVIGVITFIGFSHQVFAATIHPAGTLISQNGAVWRISDNSTSRQSFDSVERFYSNRFSFTAVVPANTGDMTLPDAGLYPWGDGVLFNDSGTIYQVSGSQKHAFTSADVFLGQGFAFSQALKGNLSALVAGVPISDPTAAHLPGTFVRSANGAISEITSSGAQAFPSAAVFFSNGGSFTSAVPGAVTPTSIASYRIGSIVNDNGGIWQISAAGKIGFPTAACYTNFGFTFGMAITGSTQGLSVVGSACGDNPFSDALSSYSTQNVNVNGATYKVEVETFNLASGKIHVRTDDASHATCITNCLVLPLSSYINADGAVAGMNGSYFCPVAYGASCAGKTNSFYAKMIDSQTGTLINSDNEYGRAFPFITFSSNGSPTWYSQESQYESSGVHAAAGIGYFGLVENGAVSLQTNLLDAKQTNTATTQGAIGLKGQTLYLIHVFGSTVPQEAAVLQAMGLDDALLLDGGGSTAMIYNSAYRSGPGRDLPNAITVSELP